MNAVGMGGLAAGPDAQLTGDLAELAEHVLPLAHPQVVEVLAAAQPAELIAGQFLLPRPQVVPQLDEGDEVAARCLVDGEAAVQLVGSLTVFGRAFRGSWMLSAAAMTITSRTQPCRSASTTIRAMRGSIGRRASCRPIFVNRRSVTAPAVAAGCNAPSSSSSR